MKTSIKVSGFDDLIDEIGLVGEKAQEAVEKVIEIAAFRTHQYAVEGILSGAANGVVYKKYNPRRLHRASSPDQYPASDTGRLASSIQIEYDLPIVRVGTALKYGAYLEFGTSKMASRPWLMPSVEKAIVDVKREIKAGLDL